MEYEEHKPFRTIDEQIDILKNHNLYIEDEDAAKNFLKRNNYYRLSGYFIPHKDSGEDKLFLPGITFQKLISIYEFDRHFRNVLLNYLEIIEVAFKSVYSYRFAEKYPSTAYLDESCFDNKQTHQELLNTIFDQIEKRKEQERFVLHYQELNAEMPIWAIIHLITFGNMSKLYEISSLDIQEKVAKDFEFNLSNKVELVIKFMHNFTILRNLCAHNSRLYARVFSQKPELSNDEKSLLRKKENGDPVSEFVFSYLLALRRFLLKKEFLNLKYDIHRIHSFYPDVDLKYYGFPDNWEEAMTKASEFLPKQPKQFNKKTKKHD